MARMQLGERALVVAMDHARTLGAVEGLVEDTGAVIDRVIAAGADGIMTSYGIVKRYREKLIGKIPTYLRLDAGPSQWREDWLKFTEWTRHYGVDDARMLGCDGVCVMAFMGSEVEVTTFDIVAQTVSEAAEDGMPVMVEALPCPCERIPDPNDAGMMASASRIAFELGADIVKTYYTGDPDGFRRVTQAVPVPVLIAGGVRMPTDRAALEVVHGSVQGGGKGVVFGRNIWQSKEPGGIVTAMRAIIHDGADVEAAMAKGGLRD